MWKSSKVDFRWLREDLKEYIKEKKMTAALKNKNMFYQKIIISMWVESLNICVDVI